MYRQGHRDPGKRSHEASLPAPASVSGHPVNFRFPVSAASQTGVYPLPFIREQSWLEEYRTPATSGVRQYRLRQLRSFPGLEVGAGRAQLPRADDPDGIPRQ